MRCTTRTGVIAVAAVCGAMAATATAHADAAADGAASGSPGLISGNTLQLPVHVPVNVCGNTLNVAGVLNPAAGNTCATQDDQANAAGAPQAAADGSALDSPGVVSGNGIKLPVHLPVNVSGNTVGVVGVGNPAFDNDSTSSSVNRPRHPEPAMPTPPPAPTAPVESPVPPAVGHPFEYHPGPVMARYVPPQKPIESLADTGADGILEAAAASGALLAGGVALHRRFRTHAAR